MHHLHALLLAFDDRLRRSRSRAGESGQATVEYALVVLGAATIAVLLLTWAARTGRISTLLDRVMDLVSERAE